MFHVHVWAHSEKLALGFTWKVNFLWVSNPQKDIVSHLHFYCTFVHVSRQQWIDSNHTQGSSWVHTNWCVVVCSRNRCARAVSIPHQAQGVYAPIMHTPIMHTPNNASLVADHFYAHKRRQTEEIWTIPVRIPTYSTRSEHSDRGQWS